jgi:hypothetical protein
MNTHGTIEEPVSKQRIGKHTTIGVLSETMFSIRSLQSGYKEEFSWEKSIEFRSSKWAVSSELKGSLKMPVEDDGEEMATSSVEDFMCAVVTVRRL